MKNRIQPGRTLTVKAPAATKSGDLVVVGDAFGVANFDAAQNEPLELSLGEVFTLPKAAGQAWTDCVALYWDATNKVVTTSAGAGANRKIGVSGAPALSAAVVGAVRLNDSF